MTATPKILAFAGSTRSGSFNRNVLTVAVEGARVAGAEVTVLDLAEYSLPIYNGDLEKAEGLPENAAKLQALFAAHDGFLIASPEYNGFFSPLLKNMLDWISRLPDEAPEPYDGKVAAIMSASPGGLGGMRGLVHVRQLLTNLGMIVLPDQVAVSSAHKVIDESGTLTDERKKKQLEGLGAKLAELAGKLAATS